MILPKQINPDMLIPSIVLIASCLIAITGNCRPDRDFSAVWSGNDQPVFELEAVVVDAKRIGQGGSHLKLLIAVRIWKFTGTRTVALVWRQEVQTSWDSSSQLN